MEHEPLIRRFHESYATKLFDWSPKQSRLAKLYNWEQYPGTCNAKLLKHNFNSLFQPMAIIMCQSACLEHIVHLLTNTHLSQRRVKRIEKSANSCQRHVRVARITYHMRDLKTGNVEESDLVSIPHPNLPAQLPRQ